MKTISKKTSKITKEAMAKKLYNDLTLEQKNALWGLIGKVACGEVKNFYSTKTYKTLAKGIDENQRIVISYICKKVGLLNVFGDMEDLVLAKE